ncbi:MAG: hypothetical protein JKX92_10440 [Porticoccaceae bacterium]|nr:hypothetical protein [Porticoccaceae bacterium]
MKHTITALLLSILFTSTAMANTEEAQEHGHKHGPKHAQQHSQERTAKQAHGHSHEPKQGHQHNQNQNQNQNQNHAPKHSQVHGHSHGSAHGHEHKSTPVSHEVIEKNAGAIIASLIKRGKIDQSWTASTPNSMNQKEFNGRPEWVVTYTNKNIPQSEKQTLYVFLTLSGQYIAANHTGH